MKLEDIMEMPWQWQFDLRKAQSNFWKSIDFDKCHEDEDYKKEMISYALRLNISKEEIDEELNFELPF